MPKIGNYKYAVPLEDQHLIAELYDEGLSLRTIAKKFETTSTTIRRTLLNFGIKMRRPGRTYESID